MFKPWTRDDTRNWIEQVENRLRDFDYYNARTLDWCANNYIYEPTLIVACSMVTMLWVSALRGENCTQREILEILGVMGWESVGNIEFSLGQDFVEYDHDQLLETVVSMFSK